MINLCYWMMGLDWLKFLLELDVQIWGKNKAHKHQEKVDNQ
jgi:hypothetical protein